MDAVDSNVSEILAKLPLEQQLKAQSMKFTFTQASNEQLQELAYGFAVSLMHTQNMLKEMMLERLLQEPFVNSLDYQADISAD